MAAKKSDGEKAGFLFDIETVSIPIPEGGDDRHLYEARIMFTAPSGHSLNDVYGALCAWVLHGSKGKAEVLAQYGGGMKNKTILSPAGRKAMLSKGGGGVICTEFINESIPKKDTTILVIRKKQEAPKKQSKKKAG